MKTIYITLLVLCYTFVSKAQSWTAHSNGNDLYFTGGKVGIGTSAPVDHLHIYAGHLRLSNTWRIKWGGGDTYIRGSSGANYLRLKTDAGGSIDFRTGGEYVRMRIDSLGYIGIGTTTPLNPLQVSGSGTNEGGVSVASEVVARFTSTSNHSAISVDAIAGQDPILYLAEDGEAMWDVRSDQSDADKFQVRWQNRVGTNTARLTIDNSGKIGVGTVSPSARFDVFQGGTLGGKFAPSNALLSVGDGTIDLVMDGNEIYSNHVLALGSSYTQDISFRNVDASGHEHLMTIKPSGNVGIGTTGPLNPFQISKVGTNEGGVSNASEVVARFTSTANHSAISVDAIAGQDPILYLAEAGDAMWDVRSDQSDADKFQVRWQNQAGANTARLTIDNTGKVGIGTTSPQEKLSVDGTVLAEEVKIVLDVNFPDYVFEDDYDLRSLEEIEKFIKSNNHLPEIPSASEVEEKGLELGHMNVLLVKKIEELTLYTIDQESKIKDQSSEIRNLRSNNEQLHQKLEALLDRVEKLEKGQ